MRQTVCGVGLKEDRLKAFIGVIAAQFFGYAITLLLFGGGVPSIENLGRGLWFWLYFSVPILIYLVLAAMATAALQERKFAGRIPAKLADSLSYALFGVLGVYALGFTSVELLAGNVSSSKYVLADLFWVAIIPFCSAVITRWFLRNFALRARKYEG